MFFPEVQFIKLLFIPANVLDKRWIFRIAPFQVVRGSMSAKPSGSSPVSLPTRPSLLGYSILPLICARKNTYPALPSWMSSKENIFYTTSYGNFSDWQKGSPTAKIWEKLSCKMCSTLDNWNINNQPNLPSPNSFCHRSERRESTCLGMVPCSQFYSCMVQVG